MQLSETITQLSKGKESTMIITVNYDPNEKCVDNVVSFELMNSQGVLIDFSSIMNDVYDEAMNSMVEQIDWNEVYINSQPEPEPMEEEREYNLQGEPFGGVLNMINQLNQIFYK